MIVSISGGGTLTLEGFDGKRGEGVVDRPFPPGSRPEGSALGRSVRLKVERCRATEPGRWSVRVRFIDLERDLRERIRAATTQP